MPRVGDCKKGKIYAIRSHQTDLIYIGSTTQTLAQRLGSHRRKYRYYKEGKYYYLSSFEIIKYENHYIELIEDYPCDNVDQLRKQEGKWIRNEKCVNTCIAGRTKDEYDEENKDHITQKKKEYREANKEKCYQMQKKWIEENKKYVAEKRKDYYKKNKQYFLEKNRIYQSKIIQCSCGSWFRKYSIQKHLKSQIHYDNMIGLSSFGF